MGSSRRDVVEVPVGLLSECERLRACLRETLLGAGRVDDGDIDAGLVETLAPAFERCEAARDADESAAGGDAAVAAVLSMWLPWVDLGGTGAAGVLV